MNTFKTLLTNFNRILEGGRTKVSKKHTQISKSNSDDSDAVSLSASMSPATAPVRLRRVTGLEGRANDVLFVPAAAPLPPPVPPLTSQRNKHLALVFFGGDVQDYGEAMQAHRDNRNYVKWNLDATATMLAACYPHHHILVVRPSRIEYKSFSCYDNFVPSNNAGVPDHTPTHSALLHLEKLLQGVTNRLKTLPASELLEAFSPVSLPEEIDIEDLHSANLHKGAETSKSNGAPREDQPLDSTHKPDSLLRWREGLALDQCGLTLVGFSKGCVVLNQLIYEFHYTKTLTPGDAHMMRFIERIESMYWLDGGHAGGKNTWITSRSLLETLTRLNVNIWVHVSPYQVSDEGRPWIGREEKAFTSMLRKLGAKIHRYLHAEPGAAHNLLMHFEVLANFKRMQDTVPPQDIVPNSSDDDS